MMGISGLLPLLKSIQKTCHLKKFEGKTLGVDAYGWLHRGAVACAMELATEKSTRKFVDYALHRVRMLQHFGVTPYLIFDGDYLPSKAATEVRRAKKREESKKIGIGLLNAGKVSQANAEFQKSLDITPEMARHLIDELKIIGVQYIVAPYEADSQMVYLENKGIIQGIISEDSDLLVFGAKCLLTKLDQYGNCTEINKSDFSACQDINLAGWSDSSFRQMAILSGCDYLASINNMGLKTAYRMIRKYKNIEKVIQMLQFDGKFHVPKGYLESFYKAELTFLHQRVFCPHALGLVLCTQPLKPINLEDMTFIGAYVEPKIAQGVAKGDLHPMTKAPMITSNSMMTSYQKKLWAGSISKQHCVDGLEGMPIASFFKKRAPLVELDSKNFMPLPSPNLILERNYKLWTTSPITQSVLQQPKVNARSSSVSITKKDWRNKSPTNDELRLLKKVRLCADTDSLTSAKSLPLHSSPFFNPKKTQSSPPERKLGDKKNNSSTNITPNESITESLSSVSKVTFITKPDEDLGPIALKNKEINYNQRDATYQNTQINLFDLEKNKPLFRPIPSIDSMNLLPLPERFISSVDSSHSNEKLAPTSIKTLDCLKKKSCTPGQKQLRLSCATQSLNLGDKINTTDNFLTPLQRISKSANNRNKISLKNIQRPNHSSDVKIPLNSTSDKPTTLIHQLVEPLPIRLPTLDDMKNIFLNASTGSEDLIVYDSEDEPLSPVTMEETILCPI